MTQLRYLIATALAVFWLGVAPLAADEADPLFDALAEAETEAEADGIARRIWQVWLTAPDPAAQELLNAAMIRRQARDFLGALQVLDRLVVAFPDYAEGWNQRATLHFMRGDFDASLADVAEVLAREPRHFGALSGMAMILYRQGNRPVAERALRKALEIHPFLRERALLEADPGTEL